MAKAIEGALARAIPLAIGLLGSLAGMGGIGETIREVVKKIQSKVDVVIDWVIQKIVALIKSVGKMLGFGKQEVEEEDEEIEGELDSNALKSKAAKLLDKQLGDEVTIESTEKAISHVLKKLGPKGLKLWMQKDERTGSYDIMASASNGSSVAEMTPGQPRKGARVTMGIAIKLSVTSEGRPFGWRWDFVEDQD